MAISEEAVRLRAYQLWQEAGEPEGRAVEHWQQAKEELENEGPHDADGQEDAGIGYSRGTTGEDIDAITGENTLDGDVLNDPASAGSFNRMRRGRTNQ